MGFPERAAVSALRRCRHDLNSAVARLVELGDKAMVPGLEDTQSPTGVEDEDKTGRDSLIIADDDDDSDSSYDRVRRPSESGQVVDEADGYLDMDQDSAGDDTDQDQDKDKDDENQHADDQHGDDGPICHFDPDSDLPDIEFEGGFRVPGCIWNDLLEYQRTGLQWMWELHCQNTGGLIGDDMGLGKTVQLVAFLAALHYSGLHTMASIVVCPATVLRHWEREFRQWSVT